jgi:hypothetical protein
MQGSTGDVSDGFSRSLRLSESDRTTVDEESHATENYSHNALPKTRLH